MVPLSFAGHNFLADPQGAMFWPTEKALLVADLHHEKASWFARIGQFLPPYDSQQTLAALTDLVDRTAPERLSWLGGSCTGRFGGGARLGQSLPPSDSRQARAARTDRVDRTAPERRYCLGDSFHDRFGCDRL